MNRPFQVFTIFLLNLVAALCLFEINHLLSGFQITLHLEVLFLVFGAFYLRVLHGALITIFLALMIGSQLPVRIGMFLFFFLFLWLIMVWARRRVRRENPVHIRTITTILQAVMIFGYALVFGQQVWTEWAYWQRILVDLAASLIILNAVVFLWVEFQRKWLFALGWNLHAEAPLN